MNSLNVNFKPAHLEDEFIACFCYLLFQFTMSFAAIADARRQEAGFVQPRLALQACVAEENERREKENSSYYLLGTSSSQVNGAREKRPSCVKR